MAKRINKADRMIYKALCKAIAEEKIHLYLISSKVNVPGSPIYNPWECLLPILVPVLLGLILIWAAGIITGLGLMIAGIVFSSNFVKKKLESRLFERAMAKVNADYENFNDLWEFGGLVLALSADKQCGCVSPDANWKEFVVRYFADLMVEKKDEPEEPTTEVKKAA